ncbi:MAG: BolA family protein [Alphaproteobacteria bacterium]|nr:BolA family protein [Alphaproteobacteria bacterium]
MTSGPVAAAIARKLEKALKPQRLEVIDDSHRHQGHAGARAEGETHFRVNIAAAAFAGKSRLQCQRMVYDILAEELAGPVHALSVSARASDDAAGQGNHGDAR